MTKNPKTPDPIRSLSRQQKLELFDALEAKSRKARRSRHLFIPHAHCPMGLNTQMDVVMSPKSEKFVFCGNGWGKTAFAANQCMWWFNGYNPITEKFTPVPAKIYIVLDRPEKVADVWLPELRKWFEIPEEWTYKDGKPYVTRITGPTGSEIRFMFHLQEVLAAESIELDYAIFDEPPPRALYVALMRGQRTKGASPQSLLVGTPLAAPWLRTDIYEPWSRGDEPEIECFRGASKANEENLAEGYLKRFERRLNEKERRIRLMGEFFDLEGLALAHLFKRETHVLFQPELARLRERAVEEAWPCVIAIDPHPSKRTHALLLAVPPSPTDREEEADENFYVLGEIAKKAVARDFCLAMYEAWKDYRIRDIVCDSLGSADMTGGDGFKSFIQVANDVLPGSWRMRATSYQEKSDEAFVDRIQDIMSTGRLKISQDCYGTIVDIENVAWKRYRGTDTTKPALDIEHKDHLACLKYALATNPASLRRRGKIIGNKRATSFAGRLKRRLNA